MAIRKGLYFSSSRALCSEPECSPFTSTWGSCFSILSYQHGPVRHLVGLPKLLFMEGPSPRFWQREADSGLNATGKGPRESSNTWSRGIQGAEPSHEPGTEVFGTIPTSA